MKATLKVELQPFVTPNFVRAKEPKPTGDIANDLTKSIVYPLSDLDPETLEKLCEQFTWEIFKKAGKKRPPQNDMESKA